MDTSATRLALARHNAEVYGVADRIEFILCDYTSFARSYASRPHHGRNIDVIFLSPPWGGPSYLAGVPESDDTTERGQVDGKHPVFSLSSVQPIHGAELFRLTRQITRNVAYYLPRNTDLKEISRLIPKGVGEEGADPEHVEVEEEWMGSKLKALTVYFGGLVDGQEELF
jgi:trimethylguanosine synthase